MTDTPTRVVGDCWPEWRPIGNEAEGGYLPPWDCGVRVALTIAVRPERRRGSTGSG